MRDHFELERLVVTPSVPGDKTGYVDGILKWADARTLLVGREEYELVISDLKVCDAARAGAYHWRSAL